MTKAAKVISDFISWLYAYQSLSKKKAGRESVLVVVFYAAAAYLRERHSQD